MIEKWTININCSSDFVHFTWANTAWETAVTKSQIRNNLDTFILEILFIQTDDEIYEADKINIPTSFNKTKLKIYSQTKTQLMKRVSYINT